MPLLLMMQYFRCRLRDMEGFRKFRDSCMLPPQDALKLQAANGGASPLPFMTTANSCPLCRCAVICHCRFHTDEATAAAPQAWAWRTRR
jgi:hypothetical protein